MPLRLWAEGLGKSELSPMPLSLWARELEKSELSPMELDENLMQFAELGQMSL